MDEFKQLGLNVAQLRKALEGLPDDMEVVVRTEDADGSSFCGAILIAAKQESHHDNDPDFFAIDCSDEEDDLVAAAQGEG